MSGHGIPPALIETFARGWSVTRGVPAPVREGAAWRIETGLPDERRRYIFSAPTTEISALAAQIDAPLTLIKAPLLPEAVAAQLPQHWHVDRTGTMMTVDHLPEEADTMPEGIRLHREWRGPLHFVTAINQVGDPVGQGRMTLIDGFALHDRINVDIAYRRRGVGLAIMRALGLEARCSGADQGLLTATVAGRALYETLGWRARAPWTTARIGG